MRRLRHPSTFHAPRAVSTSGSTGRGPQMASTCSTSSAHSAFGSTIALTPSLAQARRSSANHGLPGALTRTSTRCCAEIHAASACRAAIFSAGATASSRSTITASARVAQAFA
jgi:hypothetical protein